MEVFIVLAIVIVFIGLNILALSRNKGLIRREIESRGGKVINVDIETSSILAGGRRGSWMYNVRFYDVFDRERQVKCKVNWIGGVRWLDPKNLTDIKVPVSVDEPEKSWQCPQCKHLNSNFTYTCRNCGFNLNQ